jgi:DeoR/GlpR family transcriptional regulator of sugar metabolism
VVVEGIGVFDTSHNLHDLEVAAADYATRTTVASVEKAAVARTASAMITKGQTIFLDGGTTTAAICQVLSPSLDITVVTHSPTVATALVDHHAVRVILIGGTLYRHSLVTVGALAIEYVNSLNVDLFFMGVSGLHPLHGLTTVDSEEAAMKRSISRRAVDTFVLASAEKLGSVLPHKVIDFSELTAAITNEKNTPTVKALRKAGLKMIQTAHQPTVA